MEQQPSSLSPSDRASRRESLDFELLYLLEQEPGLSQREIADRLGISLGKVNYCLKGLAKKGAIKLGNFRAAQKKIGYIYALTPKGVSQRIALTGRFLTSKMAEYERLKSQIETLSRELPGKDPEV